MLPLLDRITLIELSDGMQAKRLYDELVRVAAPELMLAAAAAAPAAVSGML